MTATRASWTLCLFWLSGTAPLTAAAPAFIAVSSLTAPPDNACSASAERHGVGATWPSTTRALSTLPPVDDPYANEFWETACYEGNAATVEGTRSLGFKWFSGVIPPE